MIRAIGVRPGLVLGALSCVVIPVVVIGTLHEGPDKVLAVLAVLLLGLLLVILSARAFVVMAAGLSLLIEIAVPVNQVPQYGDLKYVGAFGGFLTLLALLRAPRLPRLAPTLLMVAMFAAYLPSTLAGGDAYLTKLLLTTGLVGCSMAALVSTFDAQQRLWLARWTVLIAMAQGLYAYAEFHYRLTPLWFSFSTNPNDPNAVVYRGTANQLLGNRALRAQGSLAHPLLLGLLAAVGIALLLTMPIVHSWPFKWAAVLVLAGVFVISGTRTYIVIVPVVVLFLLTRQDRIRASRLGLGMLQLLIAGLVLWAIGFFHSGPVRTLLASNSASHRATMIGSAEYLQAHEPFSYLLSGSGYGSTTSIFASGRLPLNDGIAVIDDQFISTLAMGGAIALAVLVVLLVWAFRAAKPATVVLLAVVGLTFLSFDVLLWPSATTLFAIAIGFASPLPAHSSMPAARTRTVPEVSPALIRT